MIKAVLHKKFKNITHFDDQIFFQQEIRGTMILVVADGVTHCLNGRVASATVCHALGIYLSQEELPQDVDEMAIGAIEHAIAELKEVGRLFEEHLQPPAHHMEVPLQEENAHDTLSAREGPAEEGVRPEDVEESGQDAGRLVAESNRPPAEPMVDAAPVETPGHPLSQDSGRKEATHLAQDMPPAPVDQETAIPEDGYLEVLGAVPPLLAGEDAAADAIPPPSGDEAAALDDKVGIPAEVQGEGPGTTEDGEPHSTSRTNNGLVEKLVAIFSGLQELNEEEYSDPQAYVCELLGGIERKWSGYRAETRVEFQTTLSLNILKYSNGFISLQSYNYGDSEVVVVLPPDFSKSRDDREVSMMHHYQRIGPLSSCISSIMGGYGRLDVSARRLYMGDILLICTDGTCLFHFFSQFHDLILDCFERNDLPSFPSLWYEKLNSLSKGKMGDDFSLLMVACEHSTQEETTGSGFRAEESALRKNN